MAPDRTRLAGVRRVRREVRDGEGGAGRRPVRHLPRGVGRTGSARRRGGGRRRPDRRDPRWAPPPRVAPGLPDRRRGNLVSMLRKLLWTGLYAVIGAAATIVSRRLASGIWRVATGERPPAKR